MHVKCLKLCQGICGILVMQSTQCNYASCVLSHPPLDASVPLKFFMQSAIIAVPATQGHNA